MPAGCRLIPRSTTLNLVRSSAHPNWSAVRLVGTDVVDVEQAIDQWHEDAPHHLLGAFAYRVDDGGAATLVRDHLGVMPLYWTRDADGTVHAGDDLAEIVERRGPDRMPDEDYLAAAAALPRATGLLSTSTAVSGVSTVPPGHRVRIDADGSVTVTRWWRPDRIMPRRKVSHADAAAELSELLAEVVDDHLGAIDLSNAAVGAHFSGGLDSTAVAYLAQRSLERRGSRIAHLYSWSPGGTALDDHDGPDERPMITKLAEELGAAIWFAPDEISEPDWFASRDPSTHPRETTHREPWVARAAAEHGVTDLLSGWGGDEFVSFNGRGAMRHAVRHLRVGAVRDAFADHRRRGRSISTSARRVLAPALPKSVRVRSGFDDHPAVRRLVEQHERRLARAADPRTVQLALLDRGHLTRRVEAWHQIGLRCGVRYHYPLLDPRLIEWALSVPPEVYRTGDHSRRVFRAALDGVVPDAVRRGDKTDPVLNDLIRRQLSSMRP